MNSFRFSHLVRTLAMGILVYGSCPSLTTLSAAVGDAHTGDYSAVGTFSGVATYKSVRQTVAVAANTDYVAGVWVKGVGTGRITLRVYSLTTSTYLTTLLIYPTTTWTYYSTTFNSGANTSVRIFTDDQQSPTPATTYVDDFFLGVSGGANLVLNPGFEAGSANWDMTAAAPVWAIQNQLTSGGAPAGYTMVWQEEFDGTAIDLTKWLLNDTAVGSYVPVADAATVSGGMLTQTIYTNASGGHCTTQLDTRYKYEPKYGYVEARIRTINTSGNWWAFWTFTTEINDDLPLRPRTAGVEMDIMEHRQLDQTSANISNQIPSTLHWDGYGASHKAQSSGLRGAGLSSGFHTYGMEWTPTSYKFYIDGAYQYSVTDATATDPVPPNVPVSQVGQFLLLTGQIGGGWSGPKLTSYGTLATSTTKMDTDYVRVYQLTPAAPATPVNVQVGPNTGGGWRLGWDLTENAPLYKVKRATTAGGPYTTITTTGRLAINDLGLASGVGHSYIDTTAVAGTNYYYVVSALNGTAEGANSLEVATNPAAYANTARTGLGAARANLSGVSAYAKIEQLANVASNTDYVAGFWVRGMGRMTLRVFNTSNVQVSSTVVVEGTPTWSYFACPVFNTGANTQLKFRVDDFSSYTGAAFVDDTFLGAPGGANVLVNPGFENGVTGWTFGTIWSAITSTGVTTPNMYDGYQSLRAALTGAASGARVRQKSDVTAGTTLTAGVWVRGAGRTTLRVYDGTGTVTLATKVIDATATWTYYSTPAFSTGAYTSAIVQLEDSSIAAATSYLDDVFLGASGGANLLVNGDFERGGVAWETTNAGSIWSIRQN